MPVVIQKKKHKKVRRAVMSRDLLARLVIGWSHIFFIFSHLLLALAAAITGVLPHAPAVMKIIITVRTASLQSHFQ